MSAVTWGQVLAWRMRRQFIDPLGHAPAVDIARRLAGLQARVASAAELAAAVRLLCHGPAQGTRVTFTAPERRLPGWRGLPPVDEAARTVVHAYLGARGWSRAARERSSMVRPWTNGRSRSSTGRRATRRRKARPSFC